MGGGVVVRRRGGYCADKMVLYGRRAGGFTRAKSAGGFLSMSGKPWISPTGNKIWKLLPPSGRRRLVGLDFGLTISAFPDTQNDPQLDSTFEFRIEI